VVASIRADNAPALAVARSRGYDTVPSEFRFSADVSDLCEVGEDALHRGEVPMTDEFPKYGTGELRRPR
jgi:hypothetical protein